MNFPSAYCLPPPVPALFYSQAAFHFPLRNEGCNATEGGDLSVADYNFEAVTFDSLEIELQWEQGIFECF